MQEGLKNMQRYLVNLGVVKATDSCCRPVVMAYYTTCLKPALGGKIGQRNDREMTTLGESLDALLRGDVTTAAELLIQRFKAVETSCHDGSWETSSHLELIRPNDVTCVGAKERELAMATGRMLDKMKRPLQRSASPVR